MSEEISLVPRSQAAASPTLRDLVAILFRQRNLFLISFAAVFFLVLLYGLFAPSYTAEMKVLVHRRRIDPLASPAPVNLAFEHRDISEEELNSEVELLRDNTLLRAVVQATNLAPATSSPWKFGSRAEREERAVRRLAGNLKVTGLRKTNLITVQYTSSNSAQAAGILRALCNAFIERHQQVQRPSGESNFFGQQADQARIALEQSELALMDFAHRNAVVAAAFERDTALQKLAELQAASGQTAIQIRETAQRVQDLQAKLHTLPRRLTTQVRVADNPQLLEKLKSRLLELHLKRTELLTKFLPSYRLVQEVDQQITETQQAITAEQLTPVRDETTDQDPAYEWTRAELVKAQVDLSALQARAAATASVLAQYQQSAQRLGDRSITQDSLLRNLRSAEQTYLLYAHKREESRIGDAMDSGGILNVIIAQPPNVPALPTHSLAFFLCIGLIAAGASSTAIAFAVDYTSPAFRTPDEIIAYLDVPVLASLPARSGVQP